MSLKSPFYYGKIVFKKSIAKMVIKYLKEDQLCSVKNINEEDVFIIGYPKSGNTWMQSIISCLVYGVDPNFITTALANELVTDLNGRHFYKRIQKSSFFKSHNLPNPNYKKVIYLVRDGRDVMVSYYHMLKLWNNDVSLYDMVVHDKVYPCSWGKHVNEWVENPYAANMIVVKYEDLVLNTFQELKKITSFLDLERSDDDLDKIKIGTSFDKMKLRAEKNNHFGHLKWNKGEGQKFFRSGRIGSHVNELNLELKTHFEQKFNQELKRFKYIL